VRLNGEKPPRVWRLDANSIGFRRNVNDEVGRVATQATFL